MESITRKIRIALAKKELNQTELCSLINMKKSNLSLILDRDTYKTDVLEKLANALGYNLEINLVDQETGEKI